MLLLGNKKECPREMILDDIYLLRLKLLLFMAEDYFQGREFSDLRREIVRENAKHVQIESIDLGCLDLVDETEPGWQAGFGTDRDFYRSVRDLATLMEKIAEGQLLDKQLNNELLYKFDTIRHLQNADYSVPFLRNAMS